MYSQAAISWLWTMLIGMSSVVVCPAPVSAQESKPAAGFVYLRDIDPTILQDMRYAGANNFVGKKLPGYEAGECVLVRGAAHALSKVQADLKSQNLSLKVYDCYRPARAVAAFARWARNKSEATKAYYPRLAKTQLFGKGYIAKYSNHSRGIAVDLTLVKLPAKKENQFNPETQYGSCISPKTERAPDTSVDMGTAFDCFDVRSHTWNKKINAAQRKWRKTLVEAMHRHGFQNYKNEWWHFSYKQNQYPKKYYDFPIRPISSGRKE